MNRIIILLGFIAFHIMGFAQQKANYELAERMRKITQPHPRRDRLGP